MSIYTVHEPPRRSADDLADAERFVFVRDGFYVWAFLFAPLWMLRHRMWLVLIGYIIVSMSIGILLRPFGVPAGALSLIGLLIGLLVGLEGGTLRRFTLSRRGWKNIGVVSGEDVEDAERRFFDAWLGRNTIEQGTPSAAPLPTAAAAAATMRPMPHLPHSSDIIGLFPQPGTQR